MQLGLCLYFYSIRAAQVFDMTLKVTTSFKDIPENAIRLTKKEAQEHQKDVIDNWKPRSEVFFLRNGAIGSAGLTAISCSYMVSRHRRFLKLRRFGRFSNYSATMVPSCLIAYLIHSEVIVPEITLPWQLCPVCLDVRSIMFQELGAFLYPSIVTPAVCFLLANQYQTYDLPHIKYETLNLLKLGLTIVRKHKLGYAGLIIVNGVAALALTHLEGREIDNLLRD